MARYWTLAEIRTKIQRDTDTEAEDFIQPDEMLDLINQGIDEAESYIHTLGLEDDYFLTFRNYSLTVGQEFLDMPSDIYAHKIRGISYTEGDLIYNIQRFRGGDVFETIANAQHFTNSGDYYKYIIVNDNSDSGATPAPKLQLVPVARKTLTDVIKLWYIRNCNRLVNDSDVCDIPEFVHFVIQFVKFNIWKKEGHPNAQIAKQELEEERRRMVDTLATAVPDQDSTIPPDLSFYNEIT